MDDSTNIYALLTGEGPSPQEQAAALAAQLRRQRQVGNLALLTGDKVLAPYGQAQLQQAGALEGMLGQAGSLHSGQRFSAGEALKGRNFQAGEAEKSRSFAGGQHALDRALTRELTGLKLDAAKAAAAAKKAEEAPKEAAVLRKEFNARPEVKEFAQVKAAFEKLKGAAGGNSAAADMALVFSYMKMLDPGSTVREGEYASAKNTTGIQGYILNAYNQAKDGRFLDPEQRKHFVEQAELAFRAHANQVAPIAAAYRGYAMKAGLDPEDITLELEAPSPPAEPSKPVAEPAATLGGKPVHWNPKTKAYEVEE